MIGGFFAKKDELVKGHLLIDDDATSYIFADDAPWSNHWIVDGRTNEIDLQIVYQISQLDDRLLGKQIDALTN